MLSIQEKITVRGVESLTDSELIAYLLGGSTQAETQATELLSHYNNSLATMAKADLSRLRMVEGIGIKSATILKVAAELGRRCATTNSAEAQVITGSSDVVDIFRPYFDSMKYEECWVLFLSASNRIIEQFRVSQGGIMATVVDHRLIIKRALELLSTQMIMVHNHPSGAVEPSREDIDLTKKVKSAAALFDISLIDHIIVSSSSYFSFRSKGLL
ncbi:MAG: DNA repair protein RadC [Rikenellaceae bacterium]